MTEAAETLKEVPQENEIDPVRPAMFGADTHVVRRFNATVSGKLTRKDLENPKLWSLVAKHFTMGDTELRMMADDFSFLAYGIVTYAQGTTAKVNVYAFYKLDEVDHSEVVDPLDDYITKMMGPKKWCIVKASTGEIIKELIPTQVDAARELAEYKRVLSR